jgi:hypothetical protein
MWNGCRHWNSCFASVCLDREGELRICFFARVVCVRGDQRSE